MFDGNFLVAILVPIALCVVLPVMIVWIVSKARARTPEAGAADSAVAWHGVFGHSGCDGIQ